jgi:hypothetical protein
MAPMLLTGTKEPYIHVEIKQMLLRHQLTTPQQRLLSPYTKQPATIIDNRLCLTTNDRRNVCIFLNQP